MAPAIPTADEAGLPGFYSSLWYGALGAQGDAETCHRQAQCSGPPIALADPGVQKRLTDLGLEIPPHDQQTPEALVHSATG